MAVALDVADLDGLTEILRQYLSWDIDQLREISGVDLSAETYFNNTFEEIDLYIPPHGRPRLTRNLPCLVGVSLTLDELHRHRILFRGRNGRGLKDFLVYMELGI